VNGQCAACAGLQPLPLRGEGGKFLPGLTPDRSGRGRRDRAGLRLLLLVVLPLAVLAECQGPMFPDGILPAARTATPAALVGLVLLLVAVLLVLAVGVVAWPRRSPGHRSRLAVGGGW
jgi:hypothetical protein